MFLAFFVTKICCIKMLPSGGEKRKREVCTKQHALCRPIILISARSPLGLAKRKLDGKNDGIEGLPINDSLLGGEGGGTLLFSLLFLEIWQFVSKNEL